LLKAKPSERYRLTLEDLCHDRDDMAQATFREIIMENGPFIDDVPNLKMGGSFHGKLSNNQRV